ncbi:MAG: transcription antitermination factor NusB [Bacteroidota bacterium]
MTDKPVLNRRFVRLRAIQNLYAFYVCKQANYEWALEQIRNDFTPDIFAEAPVDKEQLAQNKAQALALFASLFDPSQATNSDQASYHSQIKAAVKKARSNYETETAKDLQKLHSSWALITDKIRQACLYILQLLIEWADVSQRQAERPSLSKQHRPDSSTYLAHNRIVQFLRANTAFTQLIQRNTISWAANIDLVVSWYNQFVKDNPDLQSVPIKLTIPAQDRQHLEYLMQAIIFEQKAIQEFFSDLDLSWEAHKRIVKKIVNQALTALEESTEKDSKLGVPEASPEWEEAQHFYTDLTTKTLEQDQAFDDLIRQHIRNWTIDRIVLLDKVILKLAMCEMMHFVNIPIKVSINEYIDLSRTYSTPQSGQFINGVLDSVAKTLSEAKILPRTITD